MKKGNVFILSCVLLLVLAVPTTAMAIETGNGRTDTGHAINLMELGSWYSVQPDGSVQLIPRQALTGGIVVQSGEKAVCDTAVQLPTAYQCTFDITCSCHPWDAGSVTKLRLYEGGSKDSVTTYIGAFYRAGSELNGQCIKTFNSGDHFFGIQNEGSEPMTMEALTVKW